MILGQLTKTRCSAGSRRSISTLLLGSDIPQSGEAGMRMWGHAMLTTHIYHSIIVRCWAVLVVVVFS